MKLSPWDLILSKGTVISGPCPFLNPYLVIIPAENALISILLLVAAETDRIQDEARGQAPNTAFWHPFFDASSKDCANPTLMNCRRWVFSFRYS
jgi:hypothetical protein